MSLLNMVEEPCEECWACRECGGKHCGDDPACEHQTEFICGDCYPADCYWCIAKVEADMEQEAIEGRLRARDYDAWAAL